MVIRCSVSLVDLKIWTFEAFRLIVTSPQVSTFSATAESDFGRSVLFIILQPVSMIYIFPFPYIVLKIPDTIRNLGYPCIINVWLLTSGSGKCHVFINWHFLTESMVSCKELWRNKVTTRWEGPQSLSYHKLGRHNLRSFLATNPTQNYFS